jgi:hypothetical protein
MREQKVQRIIYSMHHEAMAFCVFFFHQGIFSAALPKTKKGIWIEVWDGGGLGGISGFLGVC